MSAFLPKGTIFSISTAFAVVTPITALSNSNPAIAAAVGNGLTNGDVGVVASGWLDLNDRPARVSNKTTDAFALEGYDTTDNLRYPPLSGIGGYKKVTGWQQLSQTTNVGTSGGEQQFVTWKYLEDGQERSKPNGRSAKRLQMTYADDPALPWYPVLLAADADGLPRVLRMVPSGGGALYYYVYVSFDGEPALNNDQVNSVSATFSQVGPLKRYVA